MPNLCFFLLFFRQKHAKKMLSLMLEISENWKILISLRYGLWQKKNKDLLYILYLPCCFVTNWNKKWWEWLFCFCCQICIKCQMKVAQNVGLFFKKMPKLNPIKIVIFRKHFSWCLRNIYGLICCSFLFLIYLLAKTYIFIHITFSIFF